MHDLLIEDALIYDGMGGAPLPGDVAVKEGRIAAIGRGLGVARETVRADGLALAPGFIDTHTHYDAQITWDPLANPSPALGVTTVIMGNCGFTIAPCRPADRDLVMRNLTHVEGMSLEALRTGINWDFESFPQYLDALERRGVGPNAACFVGHSSVRTFVMGEDAARRSAKPQEIERMRAIVTDALAAGACGFSTTTSLQHNGELGIPMPSRLADDAEMQALTGSLKDSGQGILMMTKAEQTRIAWIEELAARAQRPFVVAALLHNNLVPEATFDDLAQIGQAAARGNRLYGAVSCTPLTFEFTMHEPYVFEGLAAWKPAMTVHGDAVRQVYADGGFRAAVKRELEKPARRMFNGEWEKMFIASTAREQNRHYEGKSLAQLSARTGQHALDFLLDLSLSEGLDTVFTDTLLNSNEEAVARMIRDPNSLLSLSDAGAHLTFLCDAGFGLHFLGHWVRDKQIMSMQEALRELTSYPAQIFGLRDRGRLAPGAWADMLLFDPATVGRGPTQRVHDLPAGASRLTTPALGVHGVWVNGSRIADAQGLSRHSRLAGQVLRSFDN